MHGACTSRSLYVSPTLWCMENNKKMLDPHPPPLWAVGGVQRFAPGGHKATKGTLSPLHKHPESQENNGQIGPRA